MTTIQIRIDEKTKKQAKKVLDRIGVDMSAAIKIYLKQIVIQKAIPFSLTTENGLTPTAEKQINKAAKEAKQGKNVTKTMNLKEALDYLKE